MVTSRTLIMKTSFFPLKLASNPQNNVLISCKYSMPYNISPMVLPAIEDPCLNQLLHWGLYNGDFLILHFYISWYFYLKNFLFFSYSLTSISNDYVFIHYIIISHGHYYFDVKIVLNLASRNSFNFSCALSTRLHQSLSIAVDLESAISLRSPSPF